MVKKHINKLIYAANIAKETVSNIFSEEIVAPMFATEWGRRISWGVSAVLALLCLGTVIMSFSTWYDDFNISKSHAMNSNHGVSPETVMQAIAQIPDEHLFGKLGVTDHGALPITSLQLRLVGIVKTDQENASRVIISEAGQPGKVYIVGDSLPSGITVNAIADDGVVLENDGHLEKLPLQRSQLAFQGMPKPLLDEGDEA